MFARLPTSKIPLGGAFEAFWSGWTRPRRIFGKHFGSPLATLTRGRSQKIRFCLLRLPCFRLFNAKGVFFDVFGGISGSILNTLTRSSRYSCDLCAGVSITSHDLQLQATACIPMSCRPTKIHTCPTVTLHVLQYLPCHQLRRRNAS